MYSVHAIFVFLFCFLLTMSRSIFQKNPRKNPGKFFVKNTGKPAVVQTRQSPSYSESERY